MKNHFFLTSDSCAFMDESIERYFRMMPMGRNSRPTRQRLWRPAADVFQIRGGWIVKLELAGVSPDEIEIVIHGDTLHVSGTRRDAFCRECVTYHQLEITYSRFERTLRFPASIEGVRVEKLHRDGLLVLYLLRRADEE